MATQHTRETPAEMRTYLRDTIDFIVLTPKILGVATSNYTTQVQPFGTDADLAGTWNAPDSAPPNTGYRVNGPTLGGGGTGVWHLYVKITDNPQVVIRNPVNIRLR